MKPSARAARDIQLMNEFRSAYVALVNSSQFGDPARGGFGPPQMVPACADGEWARLQQETAHAAGAATTSYSHYGGNFVLRNASYITNDVHPIGNWQLSLTRPEEMRPDMIVNAVTAAMGKAADEQQAALSRETGLKGIIAGFLRWPCELMEAVGPTHRTQRAAAGFIGFFGQVLVGVAVALTVTSILALFAWGWRSLLG